MYPSPGRRGGAGRAPAFSPGRCSMAGAGSTRTRSGLVVVLLLVPGEVPVVDTTRTNTQASFDADDMREATVGSDGLRRFPVHRPGKEKEGRGIAPAALLDGSFHREPCRHSLALRGRRAQRLRCATGSDGAGPLPESRGCGLSVRVGDLNAGLTRGRVDGEEKVLEGRAAGKPKGPGTTRYAESLERCGGAGHTGWTRPSDEPREGRRGFRRRVDALERQGMNDRGGL